MQWREGGGRQRQLASIVRRLEELEEQSLAAAQRLIRQSGAPERRASRLAETKEEIRRLHREAARLEREESLAALAEADVERHLREIGAQLEDVRTARERWFRAALVGWRRRADDRHHLERLKEESERLVAELLRCAKLLVGEAPDAADPRLRRVYGMLRLAGS